MKQSSILCKMDQCECYPNYQMDSVTRSDYFCKAFRTNFLVTEKYSLAILSKNCCGNFLTVGLL